MKRILSFILIAIIAAFPLSVSAEKEITVLLDGEKIEFDSSPVIINDRTMVPMRAIYEALGAKVSWNGTTRTASGKKCGVTVSFTIGEPALVVNYSQIETDAPAIISGDRTLVPVRALAEGFGLSVNWDKITRTVTLVDNHILDSFSDENGNVFSGQAEGGVPNGYGEICFANGNVYTGRFENGTFCGKGVFAFSDGASYIGSFSQNFPNGYGEYYFPDGSYWHGWWDAGAQKGEGTYYNAQTGKTQTARWDSVSN